jgi:hypothetical protein
LKEKYHKRLSVIVNETEIQHQHQQQHHSDDHQGVVSGLELGLLRPVHDNRLPSAQPRNIEIALHLHSNNDNHTGTGTGSGNHTVTGNGSHTTHSLLVSGTEESPRSVLDASPSCRGGGYGATDGGVTSENADGSLLERLEGGEEGPNVTRQIHDIWNTVKLKAVWKPMVSLRLSATYKYVQVAE